MQKKKIIHALYVYNIYKYTPFFKCTVVTLRNQLKFGCIGALRRYLLIDKSGGIFSHDSVDL